MTTVQEWSDAFDTLIADYIHMNAFGLTSPLEFDEYEKSLFLTKAQEEIVKGLYNGNITGVSFEGTEEMRRSLDTLIKQKEYTANAGTTGNSVLEDNFIHNTYNLEDDCWFIVYEQVKWADTEASCIKGKVASVYPVTHDDYHSVSRNPFRGPNKRRVLRLDNGASSVELVSSNTIGKYIMRYLAAPEPIVLTDLSSENLEINGVNTEQACSLSSLLHPAILERGVQLALQSRVSGTKESK